MTAFVQHFTFELRTGLRNRSLLFLNYLFPIGFFLIMGFVMGGINPLFIETMAPAMVIFAILSATLLGLPEPLVAAREAGIFRSYKINGVPIFSILIIPALSVMLHMTIVAIIITLLSALLFGAALPTNWLAFVIVFAVMAFTSAGIGVLLSVLSPNARSTTLLAQTIYLPSILLGGLMFPAELLPATVGKIALLLPANHAMNAFTGWAYGQSTLFNPFWSLIVLLVGGGLAFGMAVYLFSWDGQNTTRRGHPVWAVTVLLPFVAAVIYALVGV